MLRRLTASEVEFALHIFPEELPIHGNASAIDEETDAYIQADIREQLAQGNDWAWAIVCVTAKWNEYQGEDMLGGCSYVDESDFSRSDGYLPQMREAALAHLNDVLAKHDGVLEAIRVSP